MWFYLFISDAYYIYYCKQINHMQTINEPIFLKTVNYIIYIDI